jgi:cytochrome c-type biogenesis protein CcmE
MIERMTDQPKAAPPIDRRTAWKILGTVVVVVGAVGGLLAASIKEEIQLWKSPHEVVGALGSLRGKTINVGGHVLSLTADTGALVYNFEIESRPPNPHAVVKARYKGIVPDTFKTGGEVVATGKLADDGTLVADHVMAKCPSKYEQKDYNPVESASAKKY